MELKDMDPIDKAAMVVGTGLMFLGIVVFGLIETLDGAPAGHPASAAPIVEGEEVVATPGIDPAVRTGLVVAGLAVLLLYGVYRVVTPVSGYDTERTATETPAQ